MREFLAQINRLCYLLGHILLPTFKHILWLEYRCEFIMNKFSNLWARYPNKMRVLFLSLFCNIVHNMISSFAIFLLRKRELVALLSGF